MNIINNMNDLLIELQKYPIDFNYYIDIENYILYTQKTKKVIIDGFEVIVPLDYKGNYTEMPIGILKNNQINSNNLKPVSEIIEKLNQIKDVKGTNLYQMAVFTIKRNDNPLIVIQSIPPKY